MTRSVASIFSTSQQSIPTKLRQLPKYSAQFGITENEARRLQRSNWLRPFSFEMTPAKLIKKYLPFYQFTGFIKFTYSGTLIYPNDFPTPKYMKSYIRGKRKYVEVKSETRVFNLKRLMEKETNEILPGLIANRLDKLNQSIMFAGQPYYAKLLTSYKSEPAVSTMFFKVKKDKVSWINYSNGQEGAVMEPFAFSLDEAEKMYLGKLACEKNEDDYPYILSNVVKESTLALGIKDFNIEAIDSENMKIIPFAIPFYTFESIWNNAKTETLVDGLNGDVYGVKIYSPLKAATIMTLVVSYFQNMGLESVTNSRTFEVVVSSLLAALASWFGPQPHLLDLEKSNMEFLRKRRIQEVAEESARKASNPKPKSKPAISIPRGEIPRVRKPSKDSLHLRRKRIDEFIRNNQKIFEKRSNKHARTEEKKREDPKISEPPKLADKLGLYTRLGLKGTETKEEITTAYINKVKLYHPDTVNDLIRKEEAKKMFQDIVEAYNILRNDEKRKSYDETGKI